MADWSYTNYRNCAALQEVLLFKVFFMKVELVTSLKRQATILLSELHGAKEPILIVEHGQPSAYLVDIDDYEFQKRRMQILEGIAKGERDIQGGHTFIFTDAEAMAGLNRWPF